MEASELPKRPAKKESFRAVYPPQSWGAQGLLFFTKKAHSTLSFPFWQVPPSRSAFASPSRAAAVKEIPLQVASGQMGLGGRAGGVPGRLRKGQPTP